MVSKESIKMMYEGGYIDLISQTRSCERAGDRPCLECEKCIERASAFFEIGIQDPALTDEEWETILYNVKRQTEAEQRSS